MMNSLARSLAAAVLAFGLAATPAAAQFSDGYNFLKAVRDKDVTKAKGFIDKPGSTLINTRDGDSGETALLIVTKRRDAPWMAFLLQNGADTAAKDKDGNTALIVAASSGFPDGVRVMLSRRPQVDAANNRGETALIRAVHAKDAASVQMLLNAGADPDRTDNLAGMSAREYAARDIRGGQLAKMMEDAPRKSAKQVVGPSL
ncbi:ankyrin repeat domain-containing protein [Sandaracinobacteroides hominis]|uniref:ankyrin repeat domain-containing protein n=1 Tax=Sandaracinobacteroides hominis TaxID=2780086 RepID=UPI0018F2B26C|nr:ankyrin repeat domain-containing protein [Sandaracinobacteroides hominis]